jgi:SAM-dependent methyltransferase
MIDDEYTLAMRSAPRPMRTEWLRSPAYGLLMHRHAEQTRSDHESRDLTPSYVFRHATAAHALGAWRWRGMWRYAAMLVPQLERSRFTLDFGGAASPLGCGSFVVDKAYHDALDRPVMNGTLAQFDLGCADVLFSSHALEHCEDLHGALHDMHQALVPGGKLVLMVPSWTCPRWRVGTHKAADHGDHVHDFGMEQSAPADVPLRNYVNVADAVARHLDVIDAGYCGDDSIMVIAEKGA